MILHYNSFPDPLPSGVWGDGGYGSERLGPLPWRCSYWRKGGSTGGCDAEQHCLYGWVDCMCAGGGCLRDRWTCQSWGWGGGLLPYLLTNKPFILSPVDLNVCKGTIFFSPPACIQKGIGGLLAVCLGFSGKTLQAETWLRRATPHLSPTHSNLLLSRQLQLPPPSTLFST